MTRAIACATRTARPGFWWIPSRTLSSGGELQGLRRRLQARGGTAGTDVRLRHGRTDEPALHHQLPTKMHWRGKSRIRTEALLEKHGANLRPPVTISRALADVLPSPQPQIDSALAESSSRAGPHLRLV
jgi:hypothetical protein